VVRSPGSSVISVETVTVISQTFEYGLIYAKSDSGNEYIMDSETKVDLKPEFGQRLIATVTGRGYIVSAVLAPVD